LELVRLWWVQVWDVSRLQVGIPAFFLLSNVSTFKIPSALLFLNGLQASISENIGVFRDRVLSAADSIDPSNPHGSVFSKDRCFLKAESIFHSSLLTYGWYDGLETNGGGGERAPPDLRPWLRFVIHSGRNIRSFAFVSYVVPGWSLQSSCFCHSNFHVEG
jgi:hypothetical protein